MKSSLLTLLIIPFLSLLTEMAASEENGQKQLRFLCAMIMLLSLLSPFAGWLRDDTVQNEIRELLTSESTALSDPASGSRYAGSDVQADLSEKITNLAARELSDTLTKKIQDQFGLKDARVTVSLQKDETQTVYAKEVVLRTDAEEELTYAADYLKTILGCECRIETKESE